VTAVLRLVPAAADDDSPVATWAAGDGDLYVMTPDRARALAEQTRGLLTTAGANLVELRAGNAHLALDYEAWHEFVADWFSDLMVWRLVKDREQRVAERHALVASLTLSGYQHREIRDMTGASLGTIVNDQRAQGLISDKPLPTVEEEPEPVDPFRGLNRQQETLARVAAQADRGLTSLELDAETGWPMGTASGHLSRLERGRAGRGGGLLRFGNGPLRERRLPYVLTDTGRALLDQVLAARDAAEGAQ
jgi:uncharacterized protein YerC